jgi:hypothetical protein
MIVSSRSTSASSSVSVEIGVFDAVEDRLGRCSSLENVLPAGHHRSTA